MLRMGEIFCRAMKVCIWLGEAMDDSDVAVKFVNQVSHLGKFDRLIKDAVKAKE